MNIHVKHICKWHICRNEYQSGVLFGLMISFYYQIAAMEARINDNNNNNNQQMMRNGNEDEDDPPFHSQQATLRLLQL